MYIFLLLEKTMMMIILISRMITIDKKASHKMFFQLKSLINYQLHNWLVVFSRSTVMILLSEKHFIRRKLNLFFNYQNNKKNQLEQEEKGENCQ